MSNEMGPEWVKEQQARVKRMKELYQLDGRDKKDHPKAGLYTGLHQEVLTYKRLKDELEIYEKWNKRFAPMA